VSYRKSFVGAILTSSGWC